MQTVADPASPLGWDMKVGSDLDPSGRSASDLELVEDAILHRLQEDKLSLTGSPEDEVEFGVDVRKWLGEAVTQSTLTAYGPLVELALRRDPRIASVAVSLTLLPNATNAREGFVIAVQGVTVKGETIDRVVSVSQVSVEFLAQGR